MPLADDVIVYPAHGAGSACGKNLSKETIGTIGNQKETNYALRADMTQEDFVKKLQMVYYHHQHISFERKVK